MSCERKKTGMTEEMVYDDGQRVIDSIEVSPLLSASEAVKNCDD